MRLFERIFERLGYYPEHMVIYVYERGLKDGARAIIDFASSCDNRKTPKPKQSGKVVNLADYRLNRRLK